MQKEWDSPLAYGGFLSLYSEHNVPSSPIILLL